MALKLLHGATGDLVQQSLREVQILQRVSFDKNVVQFYGTCMKFGMGPMLVMEFLEVKYLDYIVGFRGFRV